ncbi:iron ABC transporter permease [Rhizobium sp. BK251]|uniref:ABC transporter permease n=1 Tax=Rhizobium sp. BK251 TaxID=2512125 RepID=UPI0010452169|nr:iron ABC transporter permease [Rhizobium sp. BK251]TCL65248.1 iron(III) transport system permease protein [Rhizobium sp. BK251]
MSIGPSRSTELLPRARSNVSGWTKTSCLIAILMALPVLGIASQTILPSAGLWTHLVANVLPTAFIETAILLFGVAAVSGILGTVLAWLVTAYDFRGRALLEWALLLPLAVPTYIIAYAYLDILHPIGALQGAMRWALGYASPREFRLPDIRSMTGCILLLGFVLYPYVYLPTRAMFLTQSANLLEAARTLGVARRALFWRVALPLARPAIAIGLSLALMEALNDVGASEFLGVRTLTVSIYSTWVTRSDLPGASQIALLLLFLVVALVSLERWARRKQRYSTGTQRSQPLAPMRVEGLRSLGLFCLGALPVLVGFVVPALYLAVEAYKRWKFAGISDRLAGEAVNTLTFAAIATVATVVLGMVLAYAARLRPGAVSALSYRLSTMGYAAPGTVIAIGSLIILASFDRIIDQAAQQWFGVSTGLLLIGSGAALVYAYVVRFLAISAGSIDAGLSRIPLSLDHASRTLGETASRTLFKVHLPLSRAAVATGALLVFVDCVKELPVTLLLRPLNFETFATHLYGEAARGTYEEASLAALAIVAIGILPVIVLSRIGRRLPPQGPISR